MSEIFYAVIILYGGIQFFELNAIVARLTGFKFGSVMIGYSLQQSVYMVTRLLLMIMLPMIGFLLDTGISKDEFSIMAHLSLLFASIMGAICFFSSGMTIGYFRCVIERYRKGGNFIRALLNGFNSSRFEKNSIKLLLPSKFDYKMFIISNSVYTLYSTGMFLTFYFALIHEDNRTMISQMSGIVNALGAVIITFVIEPAISKMIDEKNSDAHSMIASLFWGRIVAVSITGQILLVFVFYA